MINNQVDTDVDPNLKDEVDMEVDVNGLVQKTPWIFETVLEAIANPPVTALELNVTPHVMHESIPH